MYNDKIKGMLAFGMNGVMIGPDTNKNINALKKADWLVVGEIYEDETSEFWRAPGITTEEQKNINTTVYRLPCAGFAEKDGSMTNSARWVTWKYAAVPPPGQARLDQDIIAQIFLRVRDLYKKDGGKFPDPILNLSWAYADAAHPPLSQVAMEINGKALADLKDDATGTGDQSRSAVARIRVVEGRRHHDVRQLDLLRFVDRSRIADPAARHGGSIGNGCFSQLVVVLAGQSARALQSGILQSRWEAVGS